ncbi:MAG TPA: TonB family protein [Terriglobia bacterium]|nr:TonB family protein [Terriglobia bacterium]
MPAWYRDLPDQFHALFEVADVRVVKPLGMGLDESAVEAVKTWKFRPGRSNDTAVPVRVLIEVTFHLF